MFKKATSFILSLVFVLTAFGVSTLFGGVIGAEAVYYDYYTYISLPGWGAFSDADLAELYHPGAEGAQVAAPANAPERVTSATAFTVTNSKPGSYVGYVNLCSYVFYNPADTDNIQWCAKDTPSSGKTITDGYDFGEDSGICFWVGRNDGNCTDPVKINLFIVPAKGTAYSGSDPVMIENPMGFCFEATVRPDEDGYVYYDFKTDFSQIDWFWNHDDGKNYSIYNGYSKRPLPYNIMDKISGIRVELQNAQKDDVYYLADFCAYRDKRIHTDELEEVIELFDSLDPEAYTEQSYEETTEIYMRAYEVMLDPDLQTKYSQREVDTLARELMTSIRSMMPMFPARIKELKLNGFDVWTDEDLETISEGGISADPATIAAEGIGPATAEHTVEIIANGDTTFSPPYYGWSCFSSRIENEDGDIVAVKNPFGIDLSESAGLRFWLKNPEDEVPVFMQIAVGKAGESRFVADDENISRPMGEGESGYVCVSWNSFYDDEDDLELFDYLNQLDFIEILFDNLHQKSYFISDLHVFSWSMYNADMTEITKTLSDTRAYMASLNPADYTPLSWQKLEIAVNNAETLMTTYGVTQAEIDAAGEELKSRANRLVLIGDGAPLEALNYLYALIYGGNNYWRGNYTGISYNALRAALDDAESAIDSDISADQCALLTAALEDAISGLVPITHGSVIEKGFFSFEKYTGRDLNKSTGDRTEGVNYSIVNRNAVSMLPTGFDKALKMEATHDMSSGEEDEHGVLQFKSMYREGGKVPQYIIPSNGDPLVGDLTGSDGVLVWVGVNDVNLVSGGRFRVGVSNCFTYPLFEMHAIDIPIPPTGSGWIYIPWNYFDHWDEWTNGEPIRLDEIYFYIFRFDGEVKQGLEVYITGLQAYKDTSASTNAQPVISNIADGQEIDVSEGAFKPDWTVGNATLDGVFFTYGDGVNVNGEHVLKVVNGDKSAEVSFTVTGGISAYAAPIISGVENGGEYEDAVTVSWDIGEGTLNGEAVESGVEVSEPGEYVLVVTNGDKSATVTFTIKEQTPPPPQHKKGDMDGDEEITVADALKALRIAAKLVQPTEDDIAIGDVDKDGDITVADALKILRVAAKLADEGSLA